jgi:putative ABC transport system ATP-binding protein
VLADEPTGNLDSKSGEGILQLLRGLDSDGSTLVLITHDERIAASFPRRLQMHDGELIADQHS